MKERLKRDPCGILRGTVLMNEKIIKAGLPR